MLAFILRSFTVAFFVFSFFSCSHGPKPLRSFQWAHLKGSKVALVVPSQNEAARFLEVEIVNQVIEKGLFELVPKKEWEKIYSGSSDRLVSTAKDLGASYVLQIDVQKFDIDDHQGYDAPEEEDSLLASEQKVDRDTKYRHYYKVKARNAELLVLVKIHSVEPTREVPLLDASGQAQVVQTRSFQALKDFHSREASLPRKLQITELLAQDIAHQLIELIEK